MGCASHEPRVVLPSSSLVLLADFYTTLSTDTAVPVRRLPTSRARKGSQGSHRPTCGIGLKHSSKVSFECIVVKESFHSACNSRAYLNGCRPQQHVVASAMFRLNKLLRADSLPCGARCCRSTLKTRDNLDRCDCRSLCPIRIPSPSTTNRYTWPRRQWFATGEKSTSEHIKPASQATLAGCLGRAGL